MKRNTAEIKVWMLRNGHTIESIRKTLGYANNSPVSLTISGKRSTRRVLSWLREQIVVHGEEPSIEHLFEFLLSEAHWDDPGDRGGEDRADQTDER